MYTSPRPLLFGVPASEIRDVIADVRREDEGTRLYYCVDPYEVVEFCFPVGTKTLHNPRRVADEQLALDQILNQRALRPVLAPEYVHELYRHLRYLERVVARAQEALDIVGTFVENAKLQRYKNVTRHEFVDQVAKDFNILVAIAMGYASFGLARLRSLLNRLATVDALGEPVASQQAEVCHESVLTELIFDSLANELEARTDISQFDKARRREAARIDAQTVDWVLQLNRGMESAYCGRLLPHRTVFLYFSSAGKTQRIFSMPEVRSRLPMIDGQEESVRRTKDQALLHAVYGPSKSTGRTADLAIKDLEKLYQIAEGLAQFEAGRDITADRCDSCNPSALPKGTCKWREYCVLVGEVAESAGRRRQEMRNLALASQVDRYARYFEQKAKTVPHGDCLSVLNAVHTRPEYRDAVLDRLMLLRAIVIGQSESSAMFSRIVDLRERGGPSAIEEVTSLFAAFPARVVLKDSAYVEMVGLIVDYYRIPYTQRGARRDSVEAAYGLFLRRDAAVGVQTGEHEVVRCLLYLTFPGVDGALAAWSRCDEIGATYPDVESELDYVRIWAGKTLGRFSEVDRIALRAQARCSDDYRFWHGRSLNIFEWLLKGQQGTRCPFSLRDVIREARKAVELCEASPADREVLGSLYNEIAYVSSRPGGSNAYDLATARSALEHVRELIPMEEWHTSYPEYLHTDANIELQEVLADTGGCLSLAIRKRKLNIALDGLAAAIRLYPKRSYIEARRRVEQELERMEGSPGAPW